MGERAEKRFAWRLPLYGLLGAAAVSLPSTIFGNGIGALLASVALGAVTTPIVLIAFVRTVRRAPVAAASMVTLFGAGSLLLFACSDSVHTTARWLIQSGTYRARIAAQPDPAHGELKHVEWDAWGFAGAETEEYLVFDPSDSLSAAAKHRAAGTYPGIPCKVPEVRRLESDWYLVPFYTETDWNHC